MELPGLEQPPSAFTDVNVLTDDMHALDFLTDDMRDLGFLTDDMHDLDFLFDEVRDPGTETLDIDPLYPHFIQAASAIQTRLSSGLASEVATSTPKEPVPVGRKKGKRKRDNELIPESMVGTFRSGTVAKRSKEVLNHRKTPVCYGCFVRKTKVCPICVLHSSCFRETNI